MSRRRFEEPFFPVDQGKVGARVGRLVFPLLIGALLLLASALGVNGSSSGIPVQALGEQTSAILSGHPRMIRSDEWAVATPLIVSQSHLGFPVRAKGHTGALNMTLIGDVPSKDWSSVFRPELWPFGWLPLSVAFAWRWWVYGALLLVATYGLALRLALSPWFGIAAAVGLCLSPFVQWWHAEAPLALAIASLYLFVASVSAPNTLRRFVIALATTYVLVSFAFVLYPPFQVPCLLVVGAVGVGLSIEVSMSRGPRALIAPFAHLACGGVGAAAVIAMFFETRAADVSLIRGTVYPGARNIATGHATFLQVFGGVADHGLLAWDNVPVSVALGGNQCEASGFVLMGLLLSPLQVWALLRMRRAGVLWSHGAAGMAVMCCWALFLLDLFVPEFGRVNGFLGLHLVPMLRLKIGLGLLSTLAMLIVVRDLRRLGTVVPRSVLVGTTFGPVVLVGSVWATLDREQPDFFSGPGAVVVAASLLIVLIGIGRGALLHAGVAVVVLAIWMGAGVNPLYQGVPDLSASRVGRAIQEVNEAAPERWMSIYHGSRFYALLDNAVLGESRVDAFTGVSPYPRFDEWRDLDPTGHRRSVYNRYGHVLASTEFPPGTLRSPQPDVIEVGFDGCSAFAQHDIGYVLSNGAETDPCLRLLRCVDEPTMTYYLYGVIEPRIRPTPVRKADSTRGGCQVDPKPDWR